MGRLVVLDVDGTILNDHHQLAPETRDAIREAQLRGARVCLATGKLLASISGLICALELTGPQITCNGAALMDAASGAALKSWPLEVEARALAITALREWAPGMAIAWYTTGAIYSDAPSGPLDDILRLYGEPAIHHVTTLDASLPPALKLLITGDPVQLEELRDRLAGQLGARATVMRTTADFVEVVGPEVNKGAALTILSRELGIARHEIIAMGDGENDITLLDAAGLGIAMGNAMPALAARAGAITASATDLGVVHAFTALGLASGGDASRFRRR